MSAMNSKLHAQIAEIWVQADADRLDELAQSVRTENAAHAQVISGFACECRGQIEAAYNHYDSAGVIADDVTLEALRVSAMGYCTTKLKRKVEPSSVGKRLRTLLGLLFLPNGPLKTLTLHREVYAWYITAFWYDQKQSLLASFLLIILARTRRSTEMAVHSRYLMGHILNIMGYANFGVPLVTRGFTNRAQIRPWMQNAFFSYMGYSLNVVGREPQLVPEILAEAEKSLAMRPDPFYKILVQVTHLRHASQTGDIEVAEEVGAVLIEIGARSQNKRFYYSSKADIALCHGIRGILWKCEEILDELRSYNPDEADPVEQGSYYRLRGWANFFVGRFEDAFRDSELAINSFLKAKSFYLARQMSLMLRSFSKFRIDMQQSQRDLNTCTSLMMKHQRLLAKLERKFHNIPVLIDMLAEEKNLLSTTFSRVSQPGYSRAVNVARAQQELFDRLEDIVSLKTNEEAWHAISETIGPKLNIAFVSSVERSGAAPFTVNASNSGIELGLSRLNDDKAGHWMVHFESNSRLRPLQSQVDGVFTLYPTILCLFRIRDLRATITAKVHEAAIGQIARQVAHDIESPIAGLEESIRQLGALPESERVAFRNGISRIKDIVASLRLRGDEPARAPSAERGSTVELLSSLVESIVSQKRLEYRAQLGVQIDAELDSSSYGIFARVNAAGFHTVLSNVINNSVQALTVSGGEIKVRLRSKDGLATIEITDNGCGIAADKIGQLFSKGASFGKDGGSGLGLFDARNRIESWHGSIELTTSENIGTTVTVLLPLAAPPAWFVPKLQLGDGDIVVIVDDDSSIHQIWRSRLATFQAQEAKIEVRHFATAYEVEAWHAQRDPRARVHYLLDYELLGQSKTGLDIAESLGIGENAVLVTSHFEDSAMRKRARSLGVKIIPKGIAAFVPLVRATEQAAPEAVLIDDDFMIRKAWEMSARRNGIRLLTYASIEEFNAEAQTLPRDIKLYLDSCLGDGVRGEIEAVRLNDEGFTNIRLTTGREAHEFDAHPAILEIIGKSAPWSVRLN